MNNNLNQNQLSPPQSICENCKSEDKLILHTIIKSQKSPPQKLCTSCVLLLYHKSCCAQCFELYDANSLAPPALTAAITAAGKNRLLACMRCENWSHVGCPRRNVPKSPYICPKCTSPNYRYFEFRKNGGINEKIDGDAAKQLVGAARIAVVLVAKFAVAARVEAERKAKDAALARKRAREAIDHLVAVSSELEYGGKQNGAIVTVHLQQQTDNGNGVVVVENGSHVRQPQS